jgi:hypothetical protein
MSQLRRNVPHDDVMQTDTSCINRQVKCDTDVTAAHTVIAKLDRCFITRQWNQLRDQGQEFAQNCKEYIQTVFVLYWNTLFHYDILLYWCSGT